jgi:hypothetical protein
MHLIGISVPVTYSYGAAAVSCQVQNGAKGNNSGDGEEPQVADVARTN